MQHVIDKLINYLIITICLVAVIGAVVYHIYALNLLGVIISVVLVVAFLIIILLLDKKYKYKPKKLSYKSITEDTNIHSPNYSDQNENNRVSHPMLNTKYLILNTIYFILLICNFYLLFKYVTNDAIVSPWSVMPQYFFLIYALATTILLIIAGISTKQKAKGSNNSLLTLLFSAHYFLSFSAAIIIYKIGFGFDHFIHSATMDIINDKGFVDPKPFYYLGQYSIIIILHKITAISIAALQKLLVPLLAALLLPHFLLKAFKKLFSCSASINISPVVLLIIPFSFFIITTPQNLAYLFLLLALIIGLRCRNIIDLIVVYLLALAALVTQPIAGIPAIMFALTLTVYHSDIKNIKRNLYRIIFFLNAAALPGAFYVLNRSSMAGSGDSLPGSTTSAVPIIPSVIVPGQENFILNFIYLYAFNIKFVIGALILTGIIIAWRNKKECGIFSVYLAMSISVFISYLLTRQLPFDFLIYYERNNFPDRILLVSAFFLLPFILIAIYGIINKILEQNKFIKIAWLIFITALITASLYISYPRLDNYYNSRGFSTGSSDIAAVQWIHNNSKDNYIVLANQQVSAAALQQYGFLKYYQSEIFYYPIPTGGSLYRYYLDMVDKKPARDTALAAMDLVGVDTTYFVLNKYWWAFSKILEEARLEADSWQEFNNEVFVFKYTR